MSKEDIKDTILGGLLIIGTILLAIFGSWVIANLLTFAIMWCFGLEYTFMIGTGVWLILILLATFLKASKN